jgi:hypothetical protein
MSRIIALASIPVKPTRRTVRPARPFAEGLDRPRGCTCGPLFLCGACLDAHIALRATEPAPFVPSDEDAAHNAATSPANREGGFVEGESSPFDIELRTVSALEHFNESLDPTLEDMAADFVAQAAVDSGFLLF